jgi:heavy metal sensor kinase
MRRIRTIRTRFALWATALILAFLTAFGGFIYANLSLSLHAAVDDALSLSAAQTAANLNVENGRILSSEPVNAEESASDASAERDLTLIVLSKEGVVVEATGAYSADPIFPINTSLKGKFVTLPRGRDDDSIRAYILPVLDNNQVVGWVQAMQSLGSVQDSLQNLLTILLLGGGSLSLIAGFAGYFLAARTLAPIDEITKAAQQISTEDLSARLSLPDTGDEVSRLATTFNNMLDRLERGFKRERQFTADASHELRTPLTAMQAILNIVREGDRPVQEYRQALDDLTDEADHLRSLVENLLSLARGDGGLIFKPEEIDLPILLSDVSDSLRPLAQSKGLKLCCDFPTELIVHGDMDLLIRLFVNLLDNAIKYTDRGSIRLTARQDDTIVYVDITDTGVGIPANHLAHIFERFYRVETARSSGGSGLGLAIARQIVKAHRGDLEVSSTPGVGTTFTVKLPE